MELAHSFSERGRDERETERERETAAAAALLSKSLRKNDYLIDSFRIGSVKIIVFDKITPYSMTYNQYNTI